MAQALDIMPNLPEGEDHYVLFPKRSSFWLILLPKCTLSLAAWPDLHCVDGLCQKSGSGEKGQGDLEATCKGSAIAFISERCVSPQDGGWG